MQPLPDFDQRSQKLAYSAVLVAVLSLFSNGRLLVKAPVSSHLEDRNQIAQRSDERFAALKAALPKTGVIGYIGEPGDPGVGEYYLAQYALTPLVVDSSLNHAIVIGNFPHDSTPRIMPGNLHLVADFGHGVLLFASEGAK